MTTHSQSHSPSHSSMPMDRDGSYVPKSPRLYLDFSKEIRKSSVVVEYDSVNSSPSSSSTPSLDSVEVSESSTPADDCLSPTAHSSWKISTGPLYEGLLSHAKYPKEVRHQYLSFFDEFVVPALGPIPTSSSAWTPHLTQDHSPFEPSWNIQGKKQQIRFSLEPVGEHAGTALDPLSQLEPLAFVESLASSQISPSLDTTWWEHFTSELFLSNPEITALQSVSPPARVTPTCFLAFDLPSQRFEPILKAYLFPHRRALVSGKSTTQCVIDSARKLHSPQVSVLPTLAHIESFLIAKQNTAPLLGSKVSSNLGGEEQDKSIEMMAIDCISPSQARIKMYVKENVATFASVKNMYTLGGRRTGPEVDNGLAAFEKFWVSLFDSTEKTASLPAFLYLGLEVIPGVEMPDVKLYVPAWTCPAGDGDITTRLASYFRSQNWDIGSTYDDAFHELCGNGQGSSADASYTYISFAYSAAKGPYVTLYYSPNLSHLGFI